jgi:molybdopterin-biosynthesis enzyme MoeA-like protein
VVHEIVAAGAALGATTDNATMSAAATAAKTPLTLMRSETMTSQRKFRK